MSKAEIVKRIEALTSDQLVALESYLNTLASTSTDATDPVDERAERILGVFDGVRERIGRDHGIVDISSSIHDQRRERP